MSTQPPAGPASTITNLRWVNDGTGRHMPPLGQRDYLADELQIVLAPDVQAGYDAAVASGLYQPTTKAVTSPGWPDPAITAPQDPRHQTPPPPTLASQAAEIAALQAALKAAQKAPAPAKAVKASRATGRAASVVGASGPEHITPAPADPAPKEDPHV